MRSSRKFLPSPRISIIPLKALNLASSHIIPSNGNASELSTLFEILAFTLLGFFSVTCIYHSYLRTFLANPNSWHFSRQSSSSMSGDSYMPHAFTYNLSPQPYFDLFNFLTLFSQTRMHAVWSIRLTSCCCYSSSHLLQKSSSYWVVAMSCCKQYCCQHDNRAK